MKTEDVNIVFGSNDDYTMILKNGDVLSFTANEMDDYIEENNLDILISDFAFMVDVNEDVLIYDYRAYANAYGGEVNNLVVDPLFISDNYYAKLTEFED